MRKETIDEFIARGGKIQRIEASPVTHQSIQVKISSTPENRILSLADGEFYFSESKKSNKVTKEVRLIDVIDQFNLPHDIAARLRGLDVKG